MYLNGDNQIMEKTQFKKFLLKTLIENYFCVVCKSPAKGGKGKKKKKKKKTGKKKVFISSRHTYASQP